MTKDEALKMVIDYLEYQYEIGAWGQDLEGLIDCCKEALEQPAQEPVAWMSFPRPSQMIPMREFNNKKIFTDDVPLYTHPAQQPTQEVGDAEIKQMLNDIEWYQMRVEELEAELEEKNHD